ncbi:gas vesicle protein [Burkholderia vietnamiensis]|nr:gas vesicle protein [Burkholderia vietnamiensis]
MTEQFNTPEQSVPPEPQHVVTTAENDWFLQSLVSIVDSSDYSFGITLFVGGVLISGQLVGGKKYFEGFGAAFGGALSDPEAAAQTRENFAKFGSMYVSEDGSYKQDMESPHYIHLQDARCFHPSGTPIPSNGGVWWRGRIREVAGFTLGSLSHSTS